MWLSFNLNRLHRHSRGWEKSYALQTESKENAVLQKYIRQYPELYILAGIVAQGCLRTVIALPAERPKLSEGMSGDDVWPEVLCPVGLARALSEPICITPYMFWPERPTLYIWNKIYIHFKAGILKREQERTRSSFLPHSRWMLSPLGSRAVLLLAYFFL